MKSLFTPAIALMNRLGYTRKFTLLALMSVVAFAMVTYSLYASLNEEIRTSERELEGLALIEPISLTVQSIQRHRGFSAALLSNSSEAMRDRRAAKERETTQAFDAVDGKLPPDLRATEGWRNIKTNWEHLQKKGLGMTMTGNFAAHTRLIEKLLAFQVAVADEYALTLDPQIDAYYLIDTAINKLPAALEHIGQLRAYGSGILARKQIGGEQKITIFKIIGMLDDALPGFNDNLEKTGRYNPQLRSSLSATSREVADSAQQVIGAMESDILTGHFTLSPEDFFAITTSAIDKSYAQMYESLLPTTEALIKTRIAQAEKILRVSIGIALLLLLIVTYFAIGIYHSIIDNIQSLAYSARTFAGGNISERVRLASSDELVQIGDSFNEMADGFNAMLAAHKQAEEAVRESHDLLHSVVENTPARIFWKDRDSRYLGCNTRFAQDAGYSTPGELSGKTDFDMGWKDQADLYRADDRDVMESGNPRLDYEEPQTTPDGNMIWLRTSKVPLRDRSNRVIGILGVYEDITARKQAEEELREYNQKLEAINHQLQDAQNMLLQSEKMSSIGQLAAGVAHEINNPIGYVYSNLGTLEKYVQDAFGMIGQYEQAEGAIADEAVRARLRAAREKLDIRFLKDDLRALMNESKDGITRVKKIVQNLKDFSHVDASDEWHFADLHNGLDSTLNIVSNEIKYKADVVREYGDIPEVECLSSQLNQVFMNLLVNAAHAIEERGTITIRTGQQEGGVWVEIADTGKGIAPEHLNKIFDPFFTTKPVGKGTGLGLSLSYGIIQKHHGRIEVESEPGKGTTFRVWLPVRQPLENT
jgi:PAS domain S-box-containing protein